MFLITGVCGFVGNNIARRLVGRGKSVVGCDLLENNLWNQGFSGNIADFVRPEDVVQYILDVRPECVFHQGAETDTRSPLGPRYTMENNFFFTKKLVDACVRVNVPLVYASSAAVYGISGQRSNYFPEPLNVYGKSKLLVDNYVSGLPKKARVIGLRYFNVYGYGEDHKGAMASQVYQIYRTLMQNKPVKLFKGFRGIDDGMQRRDFVYIEDVTDANMVACGHLLNKNKNANRTIHDVGSGTSTTFNDLTHVIHGRILERHDDFLKKKTLEIEYFDPTYEQKGVYQTYTCAGPLTLDDWMPLHHLERGVDKMVLEYKNRTVKF